ncbi:MAG: N-acetylmuramoyl-L-alanine amidase [Alphaproteobacteria bacterium]|nr:N-acetylmuramoyl-L-alanine amidase [Alphaproteobacteria bacterium]
MAMGRAALERLCDPAAKVSAHYLIDESGVITKLVAEEKRAWHAGVSFWAGASDINARSVGIELANPGHEWGYRPFTAAQMDALTGLAREIVERHRIPPARVLAHSDVAPDRRQDPGELFDWARLATDQVGLWAGPVFEAGTTACDENDRAAVARLQRKFAQYGYKVGPTGIYDQTTRNVVAAFQRHFRGRRVDGSADAETEAILDQLLTKIA